MHDKNDKISVKFTTKNVVSHLKIHCLFFVFFLENRSKKKLLKRFSFKEKSIFLKKNVSEVTAGF